MVLETIKQFYWLKILIHIKWYIKITKTLLNAYCIYVHIKRNNSFCIAFAKINNTYYVYISTDSGATNEVCMMEYFYVEFIIMDICMYKCIRTIK